LDMFAVALAVSLLELDGPEMKLKGVK